MLRFQKRFHAQPKEKYTPNFLCYITDKTTMSHTSRNVFDLGAVIVVKQNKNNEEFAKMHLLTVTKVECWEKQENAFIAK